MRRRSSAEDIESEIAHLGDLTRLELIQRWSKAHGRAPAKGISRRLLEYSAAYVLQVKAFGDLKPHHRKALASVLDHGSGASSSKPVAASLKPGSQLVRVWNGRTHYVDVVEGGYIWNDQRFRSLSAIAVRITGARWSGPRFFGL